MVRGCTNHHKISLEEVLASKVSRILKRDEEKRARNKKAIDDIVVTEANARGGTQEKTGLDEGGWQFTLQIWKVGDYKEAKISRKEGIS